MTTRKQSEVREERGRAVRRVAMAGALALTGAVSSGCLTQGVIPNGTWVLQGAYSAGIASAAAPVAATSILAADLHASGPRVEFRNQAEIPVQVRYWVGKADGLNATGVREIRTREDWAFVAEPGETVVSRIGRPSWNTSNADAVVWIRIDSGVGLTPEQGERIIPWRGGADPEWYEVTGPLPVVWIATGDGDALFAERRGRGALVTLPEELRIPDNNGRYPMYDINPMPGGAGMR